MRAARVFGLRPGEGRSVGLAVTHVVLRIRRSDDRRERHRSAVLRPVRGVEAAGHVPRARRHDVPADHRVRRVAGSRRPRAGVPPGPDRARRDRGRRQGRAGGRRRLDHAGAVVVAGSRAVPGGALRLGIGRHRDRHAASETVLPVDRSGRRVRLRGGRIRDEAPGIRDRRAQPAPRVDRHARDRRRGRFAPARAGRPREAARPERTGSVRSTGSSGDGATPGVRP